MNGMEIAVNVIDLYNSKHPHAAALMGKEDFEALVEVFRTLSEWEKESRSVTKGKEGEQWTVSSSTGCLIENKKTAIL